MIWNHLQCYIYAQLFAGRGDHCAYNKLAIGASYWFPLCRICRTRWWKTVTYECYYYLLQGCTYSCLIQLSGLELSYGTVIQAFFVLLVAHLVLHWNHCRLLSAYSIPNILVNRLFLNLRTFDASGPEKGHTDRRGKVTELAFAQNRFLGTIGAPLDHDQWDNTALSSGVHDDEVTSTIHGHLHSSEIELDSVGNVATLVSEVMSFLPVEAST